LVILEVYSQKTPPIKDRTFLYWTAIMLRASDMVRPDNIEELIKLTSTPL
jgi:hypothetical protein